MTAQLITAKQMAESANISPKRFREALRQAGLNWHLPYARWTVEVGTDEHRQMTKVLDQLLA